MFLIKIYGNVLAVIGLNNPNAFCIGDTIYTGPKRVFPGIPSFSPELFCYMRNPNPSKYKQFVKGLNELLGEGAVQVIQFLNFDFCSNPLNST
jgi:peptide chain release factor 3